MCCRSLYCLNIKEIININYFSFIIELDLKCSYKISELCMYDVYVDIMFFFFIYIF